MDAAKAIQLIGKAKAQLIIKQPFFASLLLAMPMEVADIPTMGTDGDKIQYNPAFVAAMTLDEVVFVLAHEVMHCVFMHMYRRGHRDPMRWNIAADYIINDILVSDRVGTMPQGGLHNPQLVQQGNGTTEGIYDLLPQLAPQPQPGKGQAGQGSGQPWPGPGEPGGALDHVSDGADDEATRAAKEAETKIKVINAGRAAKQAGKLSAGLARLVEEARKTKTDWRAVLRRFFSERSKEDWSYARPKRRFLAEDLYLPSLTGERMGECVIAVDCSGSIDEHVLGIFAKEMAGIIEDARPAATHIVYFDSQVLKHDTYGPEDTLQVTPVGGGGTAFSPIWRYLDDKDIHPACVVVLTDLCCSDFGPKPDYPVLWASNYEQKAPWGEVLDMREAAKEE